MKTITLLCLIVIFTTIICNVSCNKKSSNPIPIVHVNCDSLVTDTSSTNDSAIVFMPNAFVPSSTIPMNRSIHPFVENISKLDFKIFDSLNNLVFETKSINVGWDGHSSYDNFNTNNKYYYGLQLITKSNHKIGVCGELYKLYCMPQYLLTNKVYLKLPDQLTPNGFAFETDDPALKGQCP